jgi:HK97 family phage major capsid protein
MSIQALREQRAAKAKELHALVNDKDAAWNDTKQAAYDAGMAEIDDLDGRIKRITDLNTRVAEDALRRRHRRRRAPSATTRSPKPASCSPAGCAGEDGLSAEEQVAFRNTMSTTTNSEGGYTVPTEVANNVLDALKAFGGMRAVATVLRTATGQTINYPTSDGTSETGELLAQNATAAAPTSPSASRRSAPTSTARSRSRCRSSCCRTATSTSRRSSPSAWSPASAASPTRTSPRAPALASPTGS